MLLHIKKTYYVFWIPTFIQLAIKLLIVYGLAKGYGVFHYNCGCI